MQKLLVEVSHQDQVFVEDECTKKGYTLSGFFEMLLNDYRGRENSKIENENKRMKEELKELREQNKALNEQSEESSQDESEDEEGISEKPRRGRKKKD